MDTLEDFKLDVLDVIAALEVLVDFDEDFVVVVAGTGPELLRPLAMLRVVRGRGDVLATGILEDSFEDDELDNGICTINFERVDLPEALTKFRRVTADVCNAGI